MTMTCFPRRARAARNAAIAILASGVFAAVPAAGQQVGAEVRHPIQPPQLLNAAEITRLSDENYPAVMRDSSINLGVLVRLRVMPDSTVDPASVTVERSWKPQFAAPALAVAPRMRFSPATIDGRPVPVWIQTTLSFWNEPRPSDEGTYQLPAPDREPRLLNAGAVARAMDAQYPPDLRARGEPGDVLLRFRVDPDGMVEDLQVTVLAATDPALMEPAVAATRVMRFSPAIFNRVPVNHWVTMPLRFGPPARR